MEQTADEIKHLKACINDLISVLALPAIWSGGQPSQIVSTLLDVLVGMLRLDFAYVRLSDPLGGAPIEMVRLAQGRNLTAQPQEIGQILHPWLIRDPRTSPFVVPNPMGEGEVSIAPFRMGLEVGVFVAGSRRADFPTEIEKVLMRVAANQAAIGLKEARRLEEQKRAAEELEQRVVERTGQLAAVNEDLRKEIIERKRTEEALRESEEQWRAVFEHNPTMYFMVDAAGTVLSVNPFGAAQLGYTVNELVDHPVLNVFCEADRDAVQRNVAICLDHLGQSMSWEFRKVRKDGTVLWVRETAKAVLRGQDQPIILIVCEDITERKRAEEKLRQDERELRRITDAIPQAISVLAPDGTLLHANKVVLDYTGLSLEDVKADDFRARLFHPDDLERVRDERETALVRGAPFELELRARRKDGQYRWFLVRYNPFRDEEGHVIRWYVTGVDIDDRKQAEERIQNENLALREEIDHSSMFEEIVGSSQALRKVLAQVAKVAPVDSTVLVLGETGTGKELIARAIHKRSKRSSRAFIHVNCAAIPPSLIASELFGHEKGAFTGAHQRRLGRFELADGGTIFLDEIGELPAETQIALLRVLQEREFERVGGCRPISVDVRVLAATNRDLKAAAAAGAFRQDLFYRLNVFPIQIPSLRERADDIPLLVEYLIERYAKKAGKKIRSIRRQTLDLFQAYSWPGNIRELQNVIERAVILCEGDTLSVDETWLRRESRQAHGSSVSFVATLIEREKEIIESALADCHGRIAGPLGAAAKLGIPRQTLESKIKSLGIDKHRFKARHAD